LSSPAGIIVHDDFTPCHLRFKDGRLSGILDFELAHWDHRVDDFALARRDNYDDSAGIKDLPPSSGEMRQYMYTFIYDSGALPWR
jgi:aminoglycoside phosphotransferase (APT) family kinase protein